MKSAMAFSQKGKEAMADYLRYFEEIRTLSGVQRLNQGTVGHRAY